MRRRLAWFAAAIAIAWAPLAAAQTPPPGPETFGATPSVAGVDLSADGNQLLLLVPEGDVMTAAIASVSGGVLGPRRVAHRPQGTAELVGAEWIDPVYAIMWERDSLALTGAIGADHIDIVRAASLHTPTGRLAPLFPEQTADGWTLTAPQQIGRGGPRPGVARFATFDATLASLLFGDPTGEPPVLAVYEVDLATGAGTMIERGGAKTTGWGADHEGLLRVRYEVDPASNAEITFIRDDEQSPYRVLAHWDNVLEAEWRLAGFAGTEPNHAFVSGRFGQDLQEIRRIDLATGAMSDTVFARPFYDVAGVIAETWTGLSVGFDWTDVGPRQSYIHPVWARAQALAEERFPGSLLAFPSLAQDRSAVIVRVSGPDDPASYFHLTIETGVFTHLYDAYPGLENTPLVSVRTLAYPARDGTSIPAYLTLPPGDARTGLPLVVMPHGGPRARDGGDFDWWAQFLAVQGYAVFQPQFRGSTGFGEAFERAGWRQWGGRMQDDVTDGVLWLVGEGVADPDRICIVGASYGGYAALAGATLTPELYRCAASVAGLADLGLLIDHTLQDWPRDLLSEAMLRASVFEDFSDRRGMARRSPAANASRARAPILLIHARDDAIVPIEQSERMAAALERAGKEHAFIVLAGADHFLSHAPSRIAMLTHLQRFLQTHLGPGVVP